MFSNTKKLLENNINIITILVLLLVLYIGLYQFILSIAIFRVFFYLKRFPYIQNKLKLFKEDQSTIETHWKKDKDLITITYICRGFYLVGLLFILFSLVYIKSLEKKVLNLFLSGGKNIGDLLVPYYVESIFYLGFILILCGLLVTFIAELHIIFYRNIPVKAKLIQGCVSCAKTLVITGGIGLPLIDGASNSFIVEPNSLTNSYQKNVPWGRGYGYNSTIDMCIDDALKSATVYDKNKLIDPTTGNFSMNKANLFIQSNKEILTKELPVPSCVALGLKKGWLY